MKLEILNILEKIPQNSVLILVEKEIFYTREKKNLLTMKGKSVTLTTLIL